MVTVQHGGGDDLEDDFVIDNDIVAVSEDEGAAEGEFFSDAEEEEFGGIESDAEDEPEAKAEEQKGQDEAKILKKRKRREKEKERKAKKLKLIEATTPVPPMSMLLSLSRFSRLLYHKARKNFLKNDRSRTGRYANTGTESSIADTTSWTGPRTLDHLVEFIVQTLPELQTSLSQKPTRNGAPALIFLTGAALRVADVTRILKDKRIQGKAGGGVAKLFARHFKLSEHVAYLRRSKVASAVGTPGRIGKLLSETEVMHVPSITYIMLDTTYQDTKKRSLLDIPETRDEVFKTVLGCASGEQENQGGQNPGSFLLGVHIAQMVDMLL